MDDLRRWKYKNISIFVLSIVAAFLLSRSQFFHQFFIHLGGFGYIGAFFAGILFVSTFTVATAAVVLFYLAETLSPLEIGIIAGLGAVVGDITIFRFVKDNLISEVRPLVEHFGGDYIARILHSKYFSWTLPVVGAIIVASPLPDEIGVSLMGISKMKTYQFIVLSFILNSIGIFLVVSASLLL